MNLTIAINEVGADADRLDRLTLHLRDELLKLSDVEVARLPASSVDGAKGGDASTVGTIVVTLLGSAVIQEVVRTVGSWLTRSRDRSVKIRCSDSELELSSATSSQQELLVARWISSVDAELESPKRSGDRDEPR